MNHFLFRTAGWIQIAALPALLQFPECGRAAETQQMENLGQEMPAPVRTSARRTHKQHKTITPPKFTKRLGTVPSDEVLRSSRLLDVPLIQRKGAGLKSAKRDTTARVLEAYADRASQPPSDRLMPLIEQLKQEPLSDVSASLWLEVGRVSARTGHFKQALEALRKAWDQTRQEAAGSEAGDLAETVLAEMADLYLRLGHRSGLRGLVDEVAQRVPHVTSSEMMTLARQQLETWETSPLESVGCGIVACNVISELRGHLAISRYTAPLPDEQGHAAAAWGLNLNAEDERELVERGLSAVKLQRRVRAAHPGWTWVRRTQGNSIPAPCVVHLQFGEGTGHYSAAVEYRPSAVRLEDTFLRVTDWVELKAINSCASGFFLVPDASQVPPGFRLAGEAELETVFGRASCPNSRDPSECKSKPSCGGMIVGVISKYMPAVSLYDEPLSYQPPYGPGIDLTLQYEQTSFINDSILSDTSHFGPGWKHALLSYIRAKDGSVLPGTGAVQFVSPATTTEYTRSGSAYVSRYSDEPVLSGITGGYRLTYPDGSQMDFTQPNSATPVRFYLTKQRDAQGQELTLAYDNLMRLSTVTDAAGGVTEFGYEGSDLKIRSITDPYERAATFAYSANGRLQGITDVLGLVSTIEHETLRPQMVKSFTTPYGKTTYSYEGVPSVGYSGNWAVNATDPAGYVTRVESYYHDGNTPFTEGAQAEPRPPGSIAIAGVPTTFLTTIPQTDHFHVTLSWDRKQWKEYQKAKLVAPNTNSKDYAEHTLWLMGANGDTRNVPLAHKNPGEAAEWFNYQGQIAGYAWRVGTGTQPIRAARQTEDQNGVVTWVMTQQTYNSLGLPLESTDELGRKTRLLYHANNRDVSVIQAWVDGSWQTLRTYSGYVRSLPGTITEASGLTTTIVRNTKDQPTLITVSKPGGGTESTRLTYDSNGQGTPDGQPGFLMRVERTSPVNASQWIITETMTYDDFGRVRTHTDAGSYTTTTDYDDFDRPTLITHPDGSTEQFNYERLDLQGVKDRAGRWTYTAHDAIRRPISTLAPGGRITGYLWCSCGSLYKLIDPANRVTEWKRDILGRVTEKIMPDGVTKTTYTYGPRSGRLATITRPNQQGGTPTVTYRYFIDGRLQKEDHTDNSPVTGAADITYAYEPGGLGRLQTITDSLLGNTSYTYRSLASGTPGAGQIEYINGPLTNDRIQFIHDWQDRVTTEKLINDGNNTELRSETHTWDALGRPAAAVNTLGTFTYGYSTLLNRPDSLTRPGGITSSFAYKPNDAPGHSARALASITHTLAGTPATTLSSHIYGYDPAGRITSWQQQGVGMEGTTRVFEHSAGDELIGATKQRDSDSAVLDRESWALDAAGNWLARSSGTALETRAHNNMNRLTQIGGEGSTVVEGTVNEYASVLVNNEPAELHRDNAGGGYRYRRLVPVTEGSNTVTVLAKDVDQQTTTKSWQFTVPAVSRSFSYDDNGNTLSDGQRTMTWDVKNRLRTVTKNGTTWKWDYDYRDRRVREYTNNTLTKVFVWSGTEIVQERNASGAITRTHFTGGFSDGADAAAGTKYQTLTDHLGHVREVVSATGELAARYDYTSYQGPVKVSGTVEATFQTIGRYYHHAGSGLEMALYRAYDPDLGRWLNEDPIGESGGLNLYGYVKNFPLRWIDPLGLADMPSYMEGITDPAAAQAAATANAKTPQAAKDAFRQWEKAHCRRSSSISKNIGKKPKGFRPGARMGMMGAGDELAPLIWNWIIHGEKPPLIDWLCGDKARREEQNMFLSMPNSTSPRV